MSEYDERRAQDWYSAEAVSADEIAAWYTSSSVSAAEDGAAEPSDPIPYLNSEASERQKKKSRKTKLLSLSVCAVLVVAAIVSVVSGLPSLRKVVSVSSRVQTPSVTGPDQAEQYDDYRDYFAEYYTTSSEVGIERVQAAAGLSLRLRSQVGREALSLQDIYALVNPAVVGVTTYADGEEYSWGTGVLFTEDGYIITNTHIIQGTDAATVSLTTGETFDAYLIGEDEESDIAVMKIDGSGLPCAEFGDSEEVVVGDAVAAIGNPLGEMYAGTMTNGIVSSINRSVTNRGHKMTLIQTNAALNEGNSGGPLVNVYGQVIGITNMKIMSVYYSTVEGIGFAIPSTVVKAVADQLLANGVVAGEPTIGIVAGPVSDEAIALYGLPNGVYVTEVNDGSDAKAQGLQPGDIILRVNGTSVSTVDEVNAIKGEYEVGETLTFTVYRDGETFDLDIKLIDKTMLR